MTCSQTWVLHTQCMHDRGWYELMHIAIDLSHWYPEWQGPHTGFKSCSVIKRPHNSDSVECSSCLGDKGQDYTVHEKYTQAWELHSCLRWWHLHCHRRVLKRSRIYWKRIWCPAVMTLFQAMIKRTVCALVDWIFYSTVGDGEGHLWCIRKWQWHE